MARVEIQINLCENDYDPQTFIEASVYAEELGFHTVWFGDHIYPWFHSGKRSAFVWSVISVAMDKTYKTKMGPWVTAPIGARYHPAIIAQAAATLDNMYPGRLLLGVGTGEALNERPFWNGKWPKWNERMERLIEGVRLMRLLWESAEPIKFEGKYFSSDFYYLYTKPKSRIPIYFSAIGKKAARFAGIYGDNLITICPRNNLHTMKKVILPAYMKGRAEAKKKDPGEVAIELSFSFDNPEEIVRTQWRTLGVLRKNSWSITNPVTAEDEGKKITIDDVRQRIHICKNWQELIKIIESYAEIGVTNVALNTGPNKKLILEVAKNVLDVF